MGCAEAAQSITALQEKTLKIKLLSRPHRHASESWHPAFLKATQKTKPSQSLNKPTQKPNKSEHSTSMNYVLF
jgi:hypothetical protein